MIDSAHHLSRLCDVYKAEFPGTLDHESDEKLQENLNSLNKASLTPWVLLSAGVDYPQYQKQVAMAVTADEIDEETRDFVSLMVQMITALAFGCIVIYLGYVLFEVLFRRYTVDNGLIEYVFSFNGRLNHKLEFGC